MAGYTKNQIEHFKEQLKLLMKSHNLTARKLSKEIGYSMNTIKKLSKITGKDKLLLRFYADLNRRGKETGNLKLVKK